MQQQKPEQYSSEFVRVVGENTQQRHGEAFSQNGTPTTAKNQMWALGNVTKTPSLPIFDR